MAVKCASVQSCVVFMPRIDLWAVETHFQVAEISDHCSTNHQIPEMEKSSVIQSLVFEKKNEFNPKKNKSTKMAKGQASTRASHAWMSFIEQVESIGVSTSLMILVWVLILLAIINCPLTIGWISAPYLSINCWFLSY